MKHLFFLFSFILFISGQQLVELLFFWQLSPPPTSSGSSASYILLTINQWNGGEDYLYINGDFANGQSGLNSISLNLPLDKFQDVSLVSYNEGQMAYSQLFVVGILNNGEYLFINGLSNSENLWIYYNYDNLDVQNRELSRDPSCCQQSTQTQYLQVMNLLWKNIPF